MTQDAALDILKTGVNVFLTGEPGSGKTYTLNAYIRYLREHDIAPSITASTGIAATHVGGMTIHSWSGIGIKRVLREEDLDEMGTREPLVKRITHAKVLMIDEISMLDGTTLAMVERVCRSIRRSNEVFGGLQVVLVGDFFQLPPISRAQDGSPEFCFASPLWQRLAPMVCYITEQHRQDDSHFLSTLGAIRSGEIDEGVYETLQDRARSEAECPDDIPLLFTHNADVDRRNINELSRLDTEVHVFNMTSQGKKGAIEQLKKGCLSPEILELKVGARVMFTKNNFDEGYVNGTLGTVTGFEEDTSYPIVTTREGDEVSVLPAEWSVDDGGRAIAKISQIPLRLAWAITVHKSQGMSMDAAIMDLRQAFEYGQGYVALSRVRSLSGIHLLGINHRALEVHPAVLLHDHVFHDHTEKAEAAFAGLGQEEQQAMHERFVRAMGGSATSVPVTRSGKTRSAKDTHGATHALLAEGLSLKEIAEKRSLTIETILRHIEKLHEEGREPAIAHLEKAMGKVKIARIHVALKKSEHRGNKGKIAPVKALLGPSVSYEEIRLARLFLAE